MATSVHSRIPRVRVTSSPAGHNVTCDRCPDLDIVRGYRDDADRAAVDHQRAHVGGTPATQHAGLDAR